jgi:hypothetical protein
MVEKKGAGQGKRGSTRLVRVEDIVLRLHGRVIAGFSSKWIGFVNAARLAVTDPGQ